MMSRMGKDRRPVFLDLRRIHFPPSALVSIGHRLAGLLLLLATPVLIYLFDLSLRSPDGYATVTAMLDSDWGRLAGVLIAWALGHHLLAGVRLLLLDVHVGVAHPAARRSAWWVGVGGLMILILAAGAAL